MTDAIEQRLVRRQQDMLTLTKENAAYRSLNGIRERCNITFDNIESHRGVVTLSELSTKIFAINDCFLEVAKATAVFENAREDSLAMLGSTEIESDTIELYRSYQDPLPKCQECTDRVAPLLKSLFVRMGSDALKFKADLKVGYTFINSIELDGTLRILCGGAQMNLSGLDDPNCGRSVRVYLDSKPEKDADGKKFALLIQLSMEISTYYSAKIIEIRSTSWNDENTIALMKAYKFEQFPAVNTIHSSMWRRNLGQNPSQKQIFQHHENVAVFKDFSLPFKES